MIISVKAKTNARENKVEVLDETHFVVSVTQTPIDGKANEAIIVLLAKHLGIAKSLLAIKRGESSKNKVIEILQ